jgi:phosphodiesterase/alkaline phosphatase D-like protein
VTSRTARLRVNRSAFHIISRCALLVAGLGAACTSGASEAMTDAGAREPVPCPCDAGTQGDGGPASDTRLAVCLAGCVDSCEPLAVVEATGCADADRDSICDGDDNCPERANADQIDGDGDGRGDGCEPFLDCGADVLRPPSFALPAGAGARYGAALATLRGTEGPMLLVGANGQAEGAGALHAIQPAQRTGTLLTRDDVQPPPAPGELSQFGGAVVTGDFDGDGRDDAAVGARLAFGGGMVAIFRGAAEGLSAPGQRLDLDALGCEPDSEAQAGAALAAGDFDGDGVDDLAIGAPGNALQTGSACIVFGAPEGFAAARALLLSPDGSDRVGLFSAGPGAAFGAVLIAGDGDGDGVDDLLISAPDAPNGGAVVFVAGGRGSPLAMGRVFDQGVLGVSPMGFADRFGAALALGDVDGDGRAEIAVGAPGRVTSAQPGGAVWLFRADAPARATSLAQTGWGRMEAADAFGASLAAGDFNGDAFVDLAVGAPGKTPAGTVKGAGMVFVYAGGDGGLVAAEALSQEGPDFGELSAAGDGFGTVLVAADLTADGVHDLLVGSPSDSKGGTSAGVAYVFPGNPPGARLTMGPMLGAVSANDARLWVRTNRSANVSVSFGRVGGLGAARVDAATSPLDDFTRTLLLSGLKSDTSYEYRVLVDCVEQARGTFQTPAPSHARDTLLFAYVADMRLETRERFDAFEQVLEAEPELVIYGGDNIYADRPTVVDNTFAALSRRYRTNWSHPSLARTFAAFPSYMMWDDHELFDDWYPGRDDRYAVSRAAFVAYQSAHNPPPAASDALYFNFDAGPAAFFVLDLRSHRTKNTIADGPSKTMLGARQKAAHFEWLEQNDAPFKLIVSSVPFHDWSDTRDDAWHARNNTTGGYLTERNEIFDFIATHAIEGVVLLSGDQHWAGAFRLDNSPGYPLYELMPTPIATTNRRPEPVMDPQALYVNGDYYGFGLFKIAPSIDELQLTFEWRDAEGVTRFEHTVRQSELVMP